VSLNSIHRTQPLAGSGRTDEALAELDDVRPLFVTAFGADSTQVRNLGKQVRRRREKGGRPG
jgi:hypothetical protein